jgi:phosphate ABC transporter phosphate-binding protein
VELTVETTVKQTSPVRIAILIAVGIVLCVAAYFSPALFPTVSRQATVPLKTGGTSNVDIIMENRWRTAYRKEKGIEIAYDSVGSTKGMEQMIDKQFVTAFTHVPMTEDQRNKARAKGGEVLHIPVVLCAVVPVYNLKELKGKPPLRFTGDVLAGIFMGEIDRWNDLALRKLNEGVELPDTKITVVHREDSSGTTFIFADYLHGASPAWAQKFGPPANTVAWPVGVGKSRNMGVKWHVLDTEGAIGYVDLVHAEAALLSYGAVQNKDHTAFLHADAANMTAAAKVLLGNIAEDLTFKLTNQPGADAYPICGAIWAVCYQQQPAADQKMVTELLHWLTHDGQKYAATTAYAPLPEGLIERADQRLKLIKAIP